MADDVTKRMNFFDRQFLRASDFKVEQAYHIDRRWRHNRWLHTPGVAYGLEVLSDDNRTTVTVSPGTATDALGREIVLAESITKTLPVGPTAVQIYIAYNHRETDPSSDPGITGNTRITESIDPILVRSDQLPLPDDGVLLAQAILDGNGSLQITRDTPNPNNDVRLHAAAVVDNDIAVKSLTLKNSSVDPSSWTKLSCSQDRTLAVSGNQMVLNGDTLEGIFGLNTVLELQAFGPTGNSFLALASGLDPVTDAMQSLHLFCAPQYGIAGLQSSDRNSQTLPIQISAGGSGLRIMPSGNVGIGTTDPTAPLEVNGRIKAGALTIGPWPADKDYAFLGTNALDQSDAANYALLQGTVVDKGVTFLNSPVSIRFRIGNAEKMILTREGNVGIGSDSPRAKLEVQSSWGDWLFLKQQRATEGGGGFHIHNPWGDAHGPDRNRLEIGYRTSAGVDQWGQLVIHGPTGNVGIGTDLPDAKLTIQQGANGKALFVSANMQDGSASDGGIEFRRDNLTQGIGFGFNTIYATGSNANQDLIIKSRGTGRLFLNPNQGNVGVGTKANIENKPGWNPVLTIGPSPDAEKTAVVEMAGTINTPGSEVGALVFRNREVSGGFDVLSPTEGAEVDGGVLRVPSRARAIPNTERAAIVPGPTVSFPPLGQIHVNVEGSSASMVFSTRSGGSFDERMRINSHGDFVIKGPVTASRFSGTLTGKLVGPKVGYVADQFVNKLGETLEQGDVLVIGENQTSFHYGETADVPIPEVDIAQAVGDQRVCGIVCELYGELISDPKAEDQASATRESKKAKASTKPPKQVAVRQRVFTTEEMRALDAGRVQPDQIGLMVTLGAYAHCKVDADIAPIQVGDLLTTSPTKGHAQKVVDKRKASGAIIGKALGSLKKGKGKIPVLVTLQ